MSSLLAPTDQAERVAHPSVPWAGWIHHEALGLLHVIGLNSELLSRRNGAAAPELDRIRSALAQLRALFEDFSRLHSVTGSNEVPLALESVDGRRLVEDVMKRYRAEARRLGVELTLSKSSEPVLVACDPRLVQHVLANLLDNALWFTDGFGAVELRVEECRRANGPIGDDRTEVVFSVRDDGPGVPPELRERIFDSGFSGHGSSGFGLAIARKIVDVHGGRIWLDGVDDERHGARFCFTLPRAPAG